MDAQEERDLAVRAAGGDRRAFAELYERHLDAIYRYAFYRLRTPPEAEDVTSEVFRRALAAMPRYEARRPFLAFLYGIARHVVIDHARRDVPLNLDEAAGVASELPGPDEVSSRIDDSLLVKGALARLTPLQQEVVILRYIEDRPTKEIGAILGKPESTIRGIQMRALAALREIIGVEGSIA